MAECPPRLVLLLLPLLLLLRPPRPGGAHPVSRGLVGANQEWVNPTMFVRPAGDDEAGWAPRPWAGRAPLSSPRLASLLSLLGLGAHRYPGGSIGNVWNWTDDTFRLDGDDPQQAYHAQLQRMLQAFPARAFGVEAFDAATRAVGANNLFTLDVSGRPLDLSVPTAVVSKLGPGRATRFEIGNEVYDPRQGPPPNGYATAQDYLADTRALVAAVRAAGARAGVTLGPCPFFYAGDSASSPCWGGPGGRYHRWQQNVTAACGGVGGCPFDAVVVHNYVTGVSALAGFAASELLSAFLAIPGATVANGAHTLAAEFPPGMKLWMSEYNTMYADVWYGKSDATAPRVAAFLNATENSPAQAVHVAAYLVAALKHADVVETTCYHSLLASGTVSQPGFAASALNDTSAYVDPVWQMLRTFAAAIGDGGADAQPLSQGDGAPAMNFSLHPAGVALPTDPPLDCVDAVALCRHQGGANGTVVTGTVLAVNRCRWDVEMTLVPVCGRSSVWTWESIEVYPAQLMAEGQHRWVEVGHGTAMNSSTLPGGQGRVATVPKTSLAVLEVR